MLFRVCHGTLLEHSFTDLHSYFYEYSNGQMTSRQLIALCEVCNGGLFNNYTCCGTC